MNNNDLPRHYEIEGALYPASDGYEWAAVDKDGEVYEYDTKPLKSNEYWFAENYRMTGTTTALLTPESWRNSLTPATTELDRYCLKMYGSMFDKIFTETQRTLLFLHEKGGLKL